MKNNTLPTLSEFAKKAETWLQEYAFPLWASEGIDNENGGFCEQIQFDGKGETTTKKRILVQCRQIYVYSHASAIGLIDGMGYARQGMDFISKHGLDSSWVHQLLSNGKIADATKDTYDHAFVLLALGWYQSQEPKCLIQQNIESTCAYLENNLRAEKGYYESMPRRTPRRQNPHMHLFESLLALYELTTERHYLTQADIIYKLFITIFFDSENRVVREFFNNQWRPDITNYNKIEPGHMMEWVWLLRQYQRLQPTAEIDSYCHTLFENAIIIGFDQKTSLLWDCVSPEGIVIKPSRRCWPQTECIKAALVQLDITGDKKYGVIAQKVLSKLFDYYLSQCPAGGWRDVFDEKMNNLSRTMPASTFYHIFICFQQLIHYHGRA